jgi:DNA-binding MarR family transcriptional regulator
MVQGCGLANMRKIRKAVRTHPVVQRSKPKATDPELTNANYEVLADFRFALRKFLAFSETAARKAGLTPQQHQALLTIKGASNSEVVSIRLLSARLLIHHNSAVELVDRLVEGGLVRRSRDAEDRRRARLDLTAKADRLLRSLSAAHLQELQAVRPALMNLLKQLS